MKIFKQIALGMTILLSFTNCVAQIKNGTTATYSVSGNCGMCKSTIETAVYKKGQSEGTWDADSKKLTLTYNAEKTNPDAILKRIALAGYDNQSFLAPDEAYAQLPGCCQYERLAKTAVPVKEANHAGHSHEKAQQATEKSILGEVYAAYFALKDALVKDDGANAATKALALNKALAKVDMTKMSPEEHTVWMKFEKDAKEDAEHMSGTKDIAHQRDHFSRLSVFMYEWMRVFKPAETVYLQHCPMYNDGKGADWLSKENAVKNPYYGSSMLSCGKTTETIK